MRWGATATAGSAPRAIEVAEGVVTAVLQLFVVDVEPQSEDPVYDREEGREEGAHVREVVVTRQVGGQHRQGVLELLHMAGLRLVTGSDEELSALLQVGGQPRGEAVEDANAKHIPLVEVSARAGTKDGVALSRVHFVPRSLLVVGRETNRVARQEQEDLEEVPQNSDQLRVDRGHVAEASKPAEEERGERGVIAAVAGPAGPATPAAAAS